MKIYVAGPYSAETEKGRLWNVDRALAQGVRLMQMGHTPFIPHLSHYTEARARQLGVQLGEEPRWHEFWLAQDKEWVRACDALFYIGQSKGADMERGWAEEWGMPVYERVIDIPPATQQFGHPRYKELLDEAWALHKFKARKYGSPDDPLANLHAVERMGYRPYQAALIELNNINTRICNLIKAFEAGGDLALIDEEPMRNALLDNAAFSYLALILLEEHERAQHPAVDP